MWRHVGRGTTHRTRLAKVRNPPPLFILFIHFENSCRESALLTLVAPLPDCHPSCRSCVGPLASDCLQCLKPEEVVLPQSAQLQHGVCTAVCPAHKHLDDRQTCRGQCQSLFFGVFLRLNNLLLMNGDFNHHYILLWKRKHLWNI